MDIPKGTNVIRVNVAFPSVITDNPQNVENALMKQGEVVSCLKQHLYIEILNSEYGACKNQDDVNKLADKIGKEIMERFKDDEQKERNIN